MNPLEQARQDIDQIDRKMAQLFEKRMDAVRTVVAYKQANHLPVLDASREAAVIEKNLARIQDPAYVSFYKDYIQHTMTLSREFQAQLMGRNSVAYAGQKGSYSYVALQRLFPRVTPLRYDTWDRVFDAVENGEASAGIIPFEDVHPGDIATVLDLCCKHSLYIRTIYDMPVRHSLLAVPDTNLWQIREVYSHPKALQQSEVFLRTMDLTVHPTTNTAQAAQIVAQSGDHSLAAIASPETAHLYGLIEIAPEIHTDASVTARFLVLTRERPTEGDHFSLLFTVNNQPGKLAQVIQEMDRWGFTLETIQSYPQPNQPLSYYFYAELAGSPQQAEALADTLCSVCQTVRLLGMYQRG